MIAERRYTPFEPERKLDLSNQKFDIERIRAMKGKPLIDPPVDMYQCTFSNGFSKKFEAKSVNDAIRITKELNKIFGPKSLQKKTPKGWVGKIRIAELYRFRRTHRKFKNNYTKIEDIFITIGQ